MKLIDVLREADDTKRKETKAHVMKAMNVLYKVEQSLKDAKHLIDQSTNGGSKKSIQRINADIAGVYKQLRDLHGEI